MKQKTLQEQQSHKPKNIYKFMKIVLWFILLFILLKIVGFISNNDEKKVVRNIKHVENEAAGLIDINFSIDHPYAKVKNFKVYKKYRGALFRGGLFDTDTEDSRFMGAWWLQTWFFEHDNSPQIWFHKNLATSSRKYSAFLISFITGEFIKPFKCTITPNSTCGLEIHMQLRDGINRTTLIAQRGFINFIQLGIMKLGQGMTADFFVTDDKYFTIEGKVDFVVYRVVDRSRMIKYGGDIGIQQKVLLGTPGNTWYTGSEENIENYIKKIILMKKI